MKEYIGEIIGAIAAIIAAIIGLSVKNKNKQIIKNSRNSTVYQANGSITLKDDNERKE